LEAPDIFDCIADHFFDARTTVCHSNLQNVLRQAAPLALLASGQAVVLIAGGVDVSVGAIIALSSVCMVATVWNAGVIAGIVTAIFSKSVDLAVSRFGE
jgi:ribose/xylose/arabinose/galactoside ABC-type transport system permease subunit